MSRLLIFVATFSLLGCASQQPREPINPEQAAWNRAYAGCLAALSSRPLYTAARAMGECSVDPRAALIPPPARPPNYSCQRDLFGNINCYPD